MCEFTYLIIHDINYGMFWQKLSQNMENVQYISTDHHYTKYQSLGYFIKKVI